MSSKIVALTTCFLALPYAGTRLAEIRAELGLALNRLRIRPAEMCSALRKSVALWGAVESEGHLPGEDRADFEKTRTLLAACPRLQ